MACVVFGTATTVTSQLLIHGVGMYSLYVVVILAYWWLLSDYL